MPFDKGDMLLVEYSVFVKESGELVETTSEEIAKQHKKFTEGEVYEPELVIIGEGRVIEGFEEALKEAEIGKEYEVEIKPEKAYGERDLKKIKIIPRREFLKANIVPEVGKIVEVGGLIGRIVSVEGGRIRVDFNHPLAGKRLIYKFKILKKIIDAAEKIKYLVKRHLKTLKPDEIKAEIDEEEGKVTIELPQKVYTLERIQIIKMLVANDIMKFIEGMKEVVFVERYTKGSQ
jgi:peptidylprolyl isomerase